MKWKPLWLIARYGWWFLAITFLPIQAKKKKSLKNKKYVIDKFYHAKCKPFESRQITYVPDKSHGPHGPPGNDVGAYNEVDRYNEDRPYNEDRFRVFH